MQRLQAKVARKESSKFAFPPLIKGSKLAFFSPAARIPCNSGGARCARPKSTTPVRTHTPVSRYAPSPPTSTSNAGCFRLLTTRPAPSQPHEPTDRPDRTDGIGTRDRAQGHRAVPNRTCLLHLFFTRYIVKYRKNDLVSPVIWLEDFLRYRTGS